MKAIGHVPRLPGADHAALAGQPIGLNSMVSFRQAYLQKAHDKLAVELRNGQTVKGRLSGVSDTSLTLADGRKVTDVSRGDVLKIRRKISKSAKRATLIGLGVGGGIGLAGSVVAARGSEADFLALIGGAIGIGAGALIGYLVGSREQWARIYEAKAP